MIQHVSFDFWNTLYSFDNNGRYDRAKKIKQYFGLSESIEHISNKISEVSKNFDYCASYYGTYNNPQKISFFCLLELLNKKPSNQEISTFLDIIEESFFYYPPKLIEKEKLIETLSYLKSNTKSISILSNTGLQSGNILTEILIRDYIIHYFDYLVFSDKCGFFKPDYRMFDFTYQNTNCLAKNKKNVLHIGDNLHCDIFGANNYGFKSYHFNQSNQDYNNILNLIK